MKTLINHTGTGLLLAIFLCLSAIMEGRGLQFNGLEAKTDDRTSFIVFRKNPPVFHDSLRIDFQLSTYPKSNFGYILRLRDKKNPERVFNLFYNGRGQEIIFRLNEEGCYSLIKAAIPKSRMKEMQWTDVSLCLDASRDSVFLSIAGYRFSAGIEGLGKTMKPEITFGKSEHIIDVPSFAIRELKVSGSRENFEFPFNESSGHIVHGHNGKRLGHVENPVWLVGESMRWKRMMSCCSADVAGITYSQEGNRIIIFNEDSLLTYKVTNGQTTALKLMDSCPIKIQTGACWTGDDGSLHVYELGKSDPRTPKGMGAGVAALDIETGRWEAESRSRLYTPMHHHCSFINPETGEYTIFGGFGHEMYNGEFYSYDRENGWEKIWEGQHETLYPRYFTSAGTDGTGEYLYIFGGMGNKCGEQVVGRRYFYDLHRICTRTGECEKLWEIPWEEENVVPVRSLIVVDGYFYTLCYPEYKGDSELTLYRFSLDNGSHETFCNSIPIASDEILTNANLFFDKEIGKFFTTIQVFDENRKSAISLYSLSFPPFSASDNNAIYVRRAIAYGVAAICLLCAAGALIFLRIRRRRIQADKFATAVNNPGKRIFNPMERKNAIYIFGEFTVIDRDGNDISTRFTALQKTILYLIIKYNGKSGLSSRKLSNILWPDKDDTKAKNSKGVAFCNIRKTLSGLDDISIEFEDGYYRLVLGPECWCDYLFVEEELKKGEPDRKGILDTIARGKFMSFVNDPIFDSFKDNTENMLIEFLQKELLLHMKSDRYLETIEIAEMIFRIDPLDENALRCMVKSLCAIHLKEEALSKYASFATEWRKTNKTEYSIPFKNLI
ncbi:MAG: hypothetical protein NC308_00120 [Clostridium sp.]|nr:hypothetical protein [Bacteroides sp.]MCM1197271.1 hypothetical protein [Clostridium sp.]